MSSRVQFTLFLGDGTVDHGPNGVELNNFKKTTKYIDRPAQRSFESIYNWLVLGLRTNVETHFLSVQTLVNWANEGVNLWELMMITNIDNWKLYIDNALQHGWPAAIVVRCYLNGQGAVGGHEEDEAEEEVPEDVHEEVPRVEEDVVVGAGAGTEAEAAGVAQAEGVADEGEILPSIVQQMHNEDMEAAQMEEHEYSSDEDYPIPSQWSNPGFGNPMVADSRERNASTEGTRWCREQNIQVVVMLRTQ